MTLIRTLEEKLSGVSDPEQAIRRFVENHLEHFVGDPKRAKVLSHESDTLKGPYQSEIAALKKKYYRQCLTILEQFQSARQLRGVNTRLAVLSLFGMMNWLYTWYNPRVDGDWKEVASQMSSTFLRGVLGAGGNSKPAPQRKRSGAKRSFS